MTPKTILVTGGFGFIGSHLVERLLADGHTVHVVDDLRSAVTDYLDYQQYGNRLLAHHSSIEHVYLHFGSDQFDEVYHLASPVGPVGILKYAGLITRQIIDTTYAVIDIAMRNNARLLDVSTSEVYGGGKDGACGEDVPRVFMPEATVRQEYAAAKMAAEISIINTTRVTHLNAVIIRPFNVAGPRQGEDGGFVVPRFVGQALRGESLTIYGDGEQIRAFTHVDDIVDGLILAMAKGRKGEVYNLGNRWNITSINKLARLVQDNVANVPAVYVDPKSLHGELFAEAANKYPTLSKATDELGWNPKRSLELIVKDVNDYVQSTLHKDSRA